MATGWTVRGSSPGGVRFSGRPNRPRGPPSLLHNGYQVFPGGKIRPGRAVDHSPLLVPRSWKSRAIPLSTLWATAGPVTGTLHFYLSYHLFLYQFMLTIPPPPTYSVRSFNKRRRQIWPKHVVKHTKSLQNKTFCCDWRYIYLHFLYYHNVLFRIKVVPKL